MVFQKFIEGISLRIKKHISLVEGGKKINAQCYPLCNGPSNHFTQPRKLRFHYPYPIYMISNFHKLKTLDFGKVQNFNTLIGFLEHIKGLHWFQSVRFMPLLPWYVKCPSQICLLLLGARK